jgi:hypothetical protein
MPGVECNTTKIKRGEMQKMSIAVQKKQHLIEWRRSKVLEYHSQG